MSWVNATVSSYAQRHLQTQHTKKRSEGRRGEGKEGGRVEEPMGKGGEIRQIVKKQRMSNIKQ